MVRSNLCDYSDAYIVVTFKNIVPFRSTISKINNAFVDNAEDSE